MQQTKKSVILNSLAKTVKRLRGSKSQYKLGAEYDIPPSILSDIERAAREPKLITLLKLSASFNMSFSSFAKEFEKDLPENFSVCDE